MTVPAFIWADHACRFCGARLAATTGANGRHVFHCGNCLVRSNDTPDGICGCGVHLGDGRKKGKATAPKAGQARFQCVPNPERSPTNPSAIVIRYA